MVCNLVCICAIKVLCATSMQQGEALETGITTGIIFVLGLLIWLTTYLRGSDLLTFCGLILVLLCR